MEYVHTNNNLLQVVVGILLFYLAPIVTDKVAILTCYLLLCCLLSSLLSRVRLPHAW